DPRGRTAGVRGGLRKQVIHFNGTGHSGRHRFFTGGKHKAQAIAEAAGRLGKGARTSVNLQLSVCQVDDPVLGYAGLIVNRGLRAPIVIEGRVRDRSEELREGKESGSREW